MYRILILMVVTAVLQIATLGQGVDSLAKKNASLSSTDRLLIVNTFDAMTINARNNKKELFRDLADTLKNYLTAAAWDRLRLKTTVIPGVVPAADSLDMAVFALMKENNTRKAIVIRSLETYFTETSSHEERNDDNKLVTVTAYDICAKVEYVTYVNDSVVDRSTPENCRYFTSRSVKGRFNISFGPDIVGKRKHTYKMVEQSADNYISKMSEELTQ